MQLNKGSKGFSFSKEGPLDMRMNPDGDVTAKEIVNRYSEKELGSLIKECGEERQWKKETPPCHACIPSAADCCEP